MHRRSPLGGYRQRRRVPRFFSDATPYRVGVREIATRDRRTGCHMGRGSTHWFDADRLDADSNQQDAELVDAASAVEVRGVHLRKLAIEV